MFTSLKKLGFPKNRIDRRWHGSSCPFLGDEKTKPQRLNVRLSGSGSPRRISHLTLQDLTKAALSWKSVRKSESPWLSKPQGFTTSFFAPPEMGKKIVPNFRKMDTVSDLPIPSCSFCLVQEWATHWSYQSWGLNVGVRYSWKNTSLVDGKCLGFFKFWVYVKYKWLKWLESNPPPPVTG